VRLTDIADGTREALRSAGAYLADIRHPTVRLGVTGLARAGKTVFITALVRNLVSGGRLPFFTALAEGRVGRAYLEPQPDDSVPRFDYEAHLGALAADPPRWPESTRNISQLRVTIPFSPAGTLRRALRPGRLHLDIVDYPGEWLLDLAMLDQSYAAWSREALALARAPGRERAAAAFLAFVGSLDPVAKADEQLALEGARRFTAFLHAARSADPALATIGPGRFLIPGELADSPLVGFAPLAMDEGCSAPRGSLAAMMERRFESYKTYAVKPFFRDHFSRLDRQIVLVDALAALDAGPAAVDDLARALEASLRAFRPGTNTWLSAIVSRRIDRILYAASKADHLPQSSHDRLEKALGLIVERASERAGLAGAELKSLAISALRATREAEHRRGVDSVPCLIGVPLAGERLGSRVFDGRAEAAVFPGDLPEDPRAALAAARASAAADDGVSVVRFRPPRIATDPAAIEPAPWPHIRLDRALDFLMGDRLA
jgi:hypothetical protein